MTESDDTTLLLEALELEREAVRRYVAHAAATSDPRLVAYWESLRRNEAEHRDWLCAALHARGVEPPPDDDEGGGS